MPVTTIRDESHFQTELTAAAARIVVVDYTASWCPPCQRIAPVFNDLSNRYPKGVFLKVDVEQCQEVAASQGVSATPTFIFYRNKVKVDEIKGADPRILEDKIKELIGGDGDTSESGHMDLQPFILKQSCECLNESDDHPMLSCISSEGGYLESDCDEQLIMSIGYSQNVKMHSLKIKAPEDQGPKTLRLFINQPHTMDFDSVEKTQPTQELDLSAKDLGGETIIPLRYVKFQNVQNLQIFVKNNQGGTETTRIDSFAIYGSPLNATNMGDFKRVAGKKGESH